MPRSSGRRPTVQRSSPASSSRRQASTAAYPASRSSSTQTPPPAATAQAPTQKQPGLFANMASTAAGVAVGSTIGHTLGAGITSMFGGSSSEAPVQQEVQEQRSGACEMDARNFTKCLDENNGNMQICDWYLQQLKSCQAAASNY